MKFQKVSEIKIERLPSCLAFEPQAQHLFIGDGAGNIYCHDIGTGARLATLQWHQTCVMAIGFYQNRLCSFDKYQNLAIWDLSSFQVNHVYTLRMADKTPSDFNPVDLAQFTQGGRYLIFGISLQGGVFDIRSTSGLYMIDVKDGELVREFDFLSRDVGSIDAFNVSRDDSQLVISGLDHVYSSNGSISSTQASIQQWRLEDGEEICSYECDYDGDWGVPPYRHQNINLAFSANASRIVAFDGELRLHMVPPPEKRWLLSEALRNRFNFSSWSSSSINSHKLHYDINECVLYDGDVPGSFDCSPVSNLVAFGTSSGYLYLKSFDKSLESIDRNEFLFEEQVFEAAIQGVLFSRDGKYVAAYAEDLSFEIWQLSFS